MDEKIRQESKEVIIGPREASPKHMYVSRGKKTVRGREHFKMEREKGSPLEQSWST